MTLAANPIDGKYAALMRSIRFIVFDFDGVFTDNLVYVSQDGTEQVCCWRGDGLGLRALEKLGLQLLILSTEQNPVVSKRAQKLKIECIQGCEDKLETLEKILSRRKIEMRETAYVGNDINDLTCLQRVGLPIVVADAHPDVLSVAKLRTQTPGGKGAVREICDWIAKARQEKL